MSWVKISGVKMSVGSNCLLRGWGQSVWGQSVLGSKCLWGQSVSGVKMSSGSKFLGVKVSLGSKCRWGQSVFGVKMGVSHSLSHFNVKNNGNGSQENWGLAALLSCARLCSKTKFYYIMRGLCLLFL